METLLTGLQHRLSVIGDKLASIPEEFWIGFFIVNGLVWSVFLGKQAYHYGLRQAGLEE